MAVFFLFEDVIHFELKYLLIDSRSATMKMFLGVLRILAFFIDHRITIAP